MGKFYYNMSFMKKFSVDLIEDSDLHYLSIDCKDRTEYSFKNRKGILTREYSDEWQSRSIELNSMLEARKYLSKDVKINPKEGREKDPSFSPGKVLRDNDYILNFLRNPGLEEWKVIFRLNRSRRQIITREGKKRRADFKYSSILIKFRLRDQRGFMEVGEGSVLEAKFNQDGLATRVREIVENHKNRKDIHFRDKVPVIFNSGDGAIVFHEILGHCLEADYLYEKISPISLADLGREIVSKNVTLVTGDKDDHFFRDITCDDEGEPLKSTVLVKNGVLKNFIADTFYKELLDLKHCGHSRVEDFTRHPMPRMYALYLKPGQYHPEELIESTSYGVYAREFGEGTVYFDKNRFYFNIKEAFLVENGRLSFPLGQVVVRGHIVEALNSVVMVADDFRFDKGISYCYKNGQTLNVRLGQPTVKINNLFVSKEMND